MRDFKEWQEMYHNNKIIEVYKNLTADDIQVFQSLNITIKNELYSGYEFEALKMNLAAYDKDCDVSKEELEFMKSLEDTNISLDRYKEIVSKIECIEKNFIICKLI